MRAFAARALSLFSFLLFFVSSSFSFGRNQVVRDAPRWRVAETPHFLIHYSDDGVALVPAASHWAEKAYDRLTKLFDIIPAQKTSLFIYSTHNRFEQNLIAGVGEGTGGVTEAFKNRIVVFNNGSQFWMEHVITHEFVHVLQFEALYGGFWKSARLLKSPLYPLWVMEGLAEYGIGDIDDGEEDLYLRDAAVSNRLPSLFDLHGFAHLKPHQVTLGYKSGASAVGYLAEAHGADKPPQLLKSLREKFEAASIIADLTKKDFPAFDRAWREALGVKYRAQAARLGLMEPETYGTRITPPDDLPAFNTSPALSPDGRLLAYLTDRRGPPELALYDLATGKHRTLAGREWSSIEHLHTDGRALSFSRDGRWLAFAGEREQRDCLYLYDVKRGRLRRVRTPLEQIRSPAFHPLEDKLVLVGMADGVNDLYTVSPRGRLLRRLTNSPDDEGDPSWAPDGKTLVYSREVRGASRHERDLMLLPADGGTPRPLTRLPGDETEPVFTPDGRAVVFVGDIGEGVRGLRKVEVATGRAVTLTRPLGGDFAPAFSRDGAVLSFSAFRNNSRVLYTAGPSLWNTPFPEGKTAALPAPPASPSPPFKSTADHGDAPYRFKASTDLFFPLFYYSSQDGLFIATLWQASEALGRHEVQSTVQYGSGERFLDYSVRYSYKRFRPQVVLSADGKNVYQDFSRTHLRREWERLAGVVYPLDRFRRLEAFFGAVHRQDLYKGFPSLGGVERDAVASASFVRDTSAGRYLSVTSGTRLRLTERIARPVAGATRRYDAHEGEAHVFWPTGGESVFALRTLGGYSTGPRPYELRLGGNDRLRGYSRNGAENHSSRYAAGNFEWRVPLRYLKGGPSFLPELAFKAVYGAIFTDLGYDGGPSADPLKRDHRLKNSVGAGIRIPTFVLQSYLITLSMDIAKRTTDGRWTWYFTLGPSF